MGQQPDTGGAEHAGTAGHAVDLQIQHVLAQHVIGIDAPGVVPFANLKYFLHPVFTDRAIIGENDVNSAVFQILQHFFQRGDIKPVIAIQGAEILAPSVCQPRHQGTAIPAVRLSYHTEGLRPLFGISPGHLGCLIGGPIIYHNDIQPFRISHQAGFQCFGQRCCSIIRGYQNSQYFLRLLTLFLLRLHWYMHSSMLPHVMPSSASLFAYPL